MPIFAPFSVLPSCRPHARRRRGRPGQPTGDGGVGRRRNRSRWLASVATNQESKSPRNATKSAGLAAISVARLVQRADNGRREAEPEPEAAAGLWGFIDRSIQSGLLLPALGRDE
ncbi:hypothetical protein GUJ93_ZPchr0013g37558 [Zizania palustris]|uniref:Uncharacterized protein n=1 Tax=Zizania palustris TaxID=103762 RepID=A0A8J5WU29_ZIZPA|nr:hypothetical protein GUJ93_ZPchr0013g37558 [Zizania palustris]